MATSRAIALISPHAWPAHDDITWRIAEEAAALARRGHRVTILTPARGAELLAAGRRQLAALRDGDLSVAVAEPGTVLVFPLGRALPTGPRRRIGGPIDVAAALEDILSRVPFDVVHIHEPLAPSPALAALRHSGGVTAATVYRFEQLAGVAFAQPLLERGMGRIDVLLAANDAARRAVSEIFSRQSQVLRGGVDADRFTPAAATGAPGIVAVARGADRTGLGFVLRVLRRLDFDTIGRVAILVPAEAPWRARAAVPKAFRERIEVIPDTGPDARAGAFRATQIALISSPDDLAGSVAAEAMASGLATLVPRSAEADEVVIHGRDGLALPPFSRDAWLTTLQELVGDPARRAALGRAAASRARARSWDIVAAELEAAYRAGTGQTHATVAAVDGRILADLSVIPGPSLSPRQAVEAAIERGLGAIAVLGDRSPDAGLEARKVAGGGLTVIPGQRIRTTDGVIVGLFVHRPVPDGGGLEATARLVHEQGGVVMVPSPVAFDPPGQDLLRRHRNVVDCYQGLSGPAMAGRAAAEDAARLLQRMGMPTTAGSDAQIPEDLGAAHLVMRPFETPHGFLDALADAQPVQRRRGLRVRPARERRRPADPAT